jgi:hypothetical protein
MLSSWSRRSGQSGTRRASGIRSIEPVGRRLRAAAEALFERDLDAFGRLGYSPAEAKPLEATIARPGAHALLVRMVPQGRIFGGTHALEVATAEPVLPPTRGLSARGRGFVKLSRVSFRPRRGDGQGARIAHLLETDGGLQEALADLHFERIFVQPDGRAVVRHLGGSLVWVLFPPLVRPVPLVDEQARATARALEAFAAAGRRAGMD